jgi:hypothetical protein
MVSNPITKTLLSVPISRDIRLRPLAIPDTKPERYISFEHALNLRLPDEDTGDWHFQTAFFERDDRPSRRLIPLAGIGETVDTTPTLGTLGVRDMSQIMIQQQLPVQPGHAVYVANHYRAIADLAMLELLQAHCPSCVNNETINTWLDTQEQVETLKQYYLEPLASQLSGLALIIFKQWTSTVTFG